MNHELIILNMTIKVFELNELVFDYDPNEIHSNWEESVAEYTDEVDFLEDVGGNRCFVPFDPVGVDYLREICDIESQQITAIGSGELSFAELLDDEEHALSNGEGELQQELDLGMRGVVFAILEIGGFPFSSCNGGCFSDDKRHHSGHYPHVAFYGNQSCIRLIDDAARENGCGLHESSNAVVLYTNDIRNLNKVARYLLNQHQ